MKNFNKSGFHIVFYFLIFAAAVLLAPFSGSSSISINNIISNPDSLDYIIFFNQRVPRVITGMFCGAGLAVSGSCLQIILKNALAEPYILGVSGFGALFLSVSIIFFENIIHPGLASLTGCLCAVFIIDYCFRYFRGDSGSTILAGVSLNILSASLILFLKYFATPEKLISLERWYMGSLDVIGFDNLLWLIIPVISGIFIIVLFSRELNIMGFNLASAHARGFDPERIRRILYCATGIISSVIVWTAGPVGFVGLIIPHIVKYISGHDMRIVIMGSAFLGGAFLVICDILARIIIAPAELPVGIITALAGSPVFLIILFRRS
ncbi:MAG: iron ABC transporter [Deltaproteobacteria bacterium]|nr:MAG: iron ABC transporter [Deltaproteobacteria bacterium]